ncbi:MAG: PQQ-binding-like beta-propeller repeat protein [Planctomycetaceae bacterium]|nr:PQQ-binding-like beta-propeller repeat protein [Planctomycetaceae bacterium]
MTRIFCFLLATSPLLSWGADRKSDWPSWRGPNRDGISTETGLLDSWPKDGPKLLWRVDKVLGNGYSSVAIADGKIFTIGKRGRDAELIALNLQDGKELWTSRVGGGNPNCTPTVDGDLVYALGRDGDLVCCDTDTGDEVWRKNYRNDFGGKMMSGWGYSESPLIDGDHLICTPGAQDAIMAALDKKTGEVIWKTAMPQNVGNRGKEGAAYSSVVISNAGGVKQYVQLTGRGVISADAKTGKLLWGYNKIANGTANIPTPITEGDHVFCSSGYGDGGTALLKLTRSGDRFKAEEVYYRRGGDMQNHHGGMILLDGHVYMGHGHNRGLPACLNLRSGEFDWGPERGAGGGSAAIIYADGDLIFRYEDGVVALIEATPKGYNLKSQFKLPTNNDRSWPHPVIAGKKLYLRDGGDLHCYDIAER